MPVSDILAPQVEAISDDIYGLPAYFQQITGLAGLGHVEETSTMPQHLVSTNSRQTYDTGQEATRQIEHQSNADTSLSQRGWGQPAPSTKTRSRRTLPTEPRHEAQQEVRNEVVVDKPADTTTNYTDHNLRRSNAYVLLKQVPQLRDGMQGAAALAEAAVQQHGQSPTVAAAMLANARSSPFQGNVPRAKSRQGQRGQSKTPGADQTGRGYQTPHNAHHTRGNSSTNQNSSQLGGMLNHGDHGPYGSGTTSRQSQRSGYESYSQTPTTSSVPTAVEPPSRNASAGMSLSSQPSSSIAAYQTTSSNQWLGSRGQDRSFTTPTSTYGTQAMCTQPTAAKATAQPKSSYDLRGSTRSTRSSTGAFGQTQQGYQSYSSSSQHQQNQTQQSQQNQMNNQQQAWYSFNNSS